MSDCRQDWGRRRRPDVTWLVLLSVGGAALQGCGAMVGSAMKRDIKQVVVPMMAGVISDTEKLGKASMAFYEAHSRWPHDYSELERYSRDQALDLTLAWIKDITLTPQEDGGLSIEFDYIAVPSVAAGTHATFTPIQIHTSSGKPLIVIHRAPRR